MKVRHKTAVKKGTAVSIWTSRFHNTELRQRPDLVKVAITVGKPRWPVGFEFVEFNWLAPYGRLFKINDRREFTVGYFEKMDGIGVDAIRKRLQEMSDQHGGKDLVLLCYENLTKPDEWCHRQVFAEWWLRETGEVIEELETGEGPKPLPRQLDSC